MYPHIKEPNNYSAALYLRLSKEDDTKEDNSASIKNQRIMLEEYARSQNIKVHDIYIDDGFSGTTFDRPDFLRMIEDIENKKVNMVITKDMSRLGRDYIDTGYYMERYFPERNIRYIALIDQIDTGDESYNGDLTPFKAIINDMYAKDTSNKIRSVKRSKQEQGLFIGGKAPYGYKKMPGNKNMLVIDQPAADVVRYIFELALDGKSCRQIAMILNDKQIKPPSQYAGIQVKIKGPYHGKWSPERISWILQNEVYIGNMVQRRSEKVSYKVQKCRKVPKEDWIIVCNTHEAIIEKAVYEKVGELVKCRKSTRQRTYDYLLKGLIYCHECQYPLGVINRPSKKKEEQLYFLCRTYQKFTKTDICTSHCVKEEMVTDFVLAQLKILYEQTLEMMDWEGIAEKINAIYNDKMHKEHSRRKELIHKCEAIEQKIDMVYEDKIKGNIEENLFQRIYEKYSAEYQRVCTEISSLEPGEDRKEFLTGMEAKEIVLKCLEHREYKRAILIQLIERVELTRDREVHFFLKFKNTDIVQGLQ